MKRVAIPGTATLKDLYDIAYKTLNLLDYGFSLFSDRGCSKELRSSRSVSLSSSKLTHGDVIYYKQMAGSSVSFITTRKRKIHDRSRFSRNLLVLQVATRAAILKPQFLQRSKQHP